MIYRVLRCKNVPQLTAIVEAALTEDTRTNIIRVATKEFSDKGFAGARIDMIADKTNYSKRMIYYYFAGKEDLYHAVLEQAYGDIREREEAQNFDAMSAEDALRALIVHTFDYHMQHPEFVRLVMNENILRGAHIASVNDIENRNQGIVSSLKRLIDRGVSEGVFRDGIEPLDLHMTMSALCFFNVSNRYTLRAIFRIDTSQADMRTKRCDQVVSAILTYVRR